MEIRHLHTFQAILKHGSFLAAAGKLGCAQSTVTLHIQQLEADLGTQLFERGSRRPRQTEAGRALQEHIGPILTRIDSLQETIAELNSGEAGHLRIGTIEPIASLRLPPLLVRFCRDRPNVRLSIEVSGTDSVSAGVASGNLDVGICSPPALNLELQFEPLYREELALLVPESHPIADAASVRITDLTGHRLLLTQPACAYRELTEQALRDHGVRPSDRITISSVAALAFAVQSGLGIAIVPRVAVDPPPKGTLLKSIEDVDLALPIGIVRPVDAPVPGRALSAFLESIRSHLARSLVGALTG